VEGQRLLVADEPAQVFPGEVLMRIVLARFGYEIRLDRMMPGDRVPLTLVHRHANGFFFSGFTPNTTTGLRLRFPQGAPLFLGYETELVDGYATYSMPRAWHRECRVFVEQEANTVLSYVELPVGSYRGKRKMALYGLEHAIVRFYPESGYEDRTVMRLNSYAPYLVGEPLAYEQKRDGTGVYLEAQDVSGWLVFHWDLADAPAEEIDQLTAIYN